MPAAYLKAPPVLPSVHIPYWCMGKARFESAVLAFEAAKRRATRGHYLCRSCGGFHVGTNHGVAAPKAVAKTMVR